VVQFGVTLLFETIWTCFFSTALHGRLP